MIIDDKDDTGDLYHDESSLPLGDEQEAQLTVTTSNYPDFEQAVLSRVLYHLADVVEDQDYLQHFAKEFALRIDSMLIKYRAGQIEHGGDIRDRDLSVEETKEIQDLFIYNLVRTTLQGLKAEIKI